ncbi:MAG: TetR/AcrR family transcriptional regulator [bacterium]|nr:TetR/AcrR family transcriptional regulator [bacterium]
MDKRQLKTRRAICKAFSKLLEKQSFEQITVQAIIDEAEIGRSTFYAHFETKDELLRVMCADIFEHVFDCALPQESDPANCAGHKNLELKLGHVLYHLRERKSELAGLLKSESANVFMRYLREHLRALFARYKEEFGSAVPEDYLLNHLAGSFAETVRWWVAEDTAHTPEEVAGFYLAVTERHNTVVRQIDFCPIKCSRCKLY